MASLNHEFTIAQIRTGLLQYKEDLDERQTEILNQAIRIIRFLKATDELRRVVEQRDGNNRLIHELERQVSDWEGLPT